MYIVFSTTCSYMYFITKISRLGDVSTAFIQLVGIVDP